MKITRILACRVELPLHERTYKWSGGKSVTVFDSTIIRVETDAGMSATASRIVKLAKTSGVERVVFAFVST